MCELTRYEFCVKNPNKLPPKDQLVRCSAWEQMKSNARKGGDRAKERLKSHIDRKFWNLSYRMREPLQTEGVMSTIQRLIIFYKFKFFMSMIYFLAGLVFPIGHTKYLVGRLLLK
jgi:hypothetical protein